MGDTPYPVLQSPAHCLGALLHLPCTDVVAWLATVELGTCAGEGGGAGGESSVDVAWVTNPPTRRGILTASVGCKRWGVSKNAVCEEFPGCREGVCRPCAISIALVSVSAALLAFEPSLCALASAARIARSALCRFKCSFSVAFSALACAASATRASLAALASSRRAAFCARASATWIARISFDLRSSSLSICFRFRRSSFFCSCNFLCRAAFSFASFRCVAAAMCSSDVNMIDLLKSMIGSRIRALAHSRELQRLAR